jgi:hypothetical protein
MDEYSRRELNRKRNQFEHSSSGSQHEGSIFTYPSSQSFTLKSLEESLINDLKSEKSGHDDWPSNWKDAEWYLKYPPKKEDAPESWPESSSEDIDSGANMPDINEEEIEYNQFEHMPDKKESDWESDQSGVMPGKKSGGYEFPSISIEGEDKKLASLFKKIPKD